MSLGGYKAYMNILLIFVPISFIYSYVKNDSVIFIKSCISMIPLTISLGQLREVIDEQTNETVYSEVKVNLVMLLN